MGTTVVNDVLYDIGLALIEVPVNTTLGTAVGAPGVATVTPPSMNGIYVGALLVAGIANSNQEVITVSSATATQFTATFANVHANTDPIKCATFSSGQGTHPLFTQTEMLAYITDVQNDFLLKVQPIIAVVSAFALSAGTRIYTQPSDCIRLERISIAGVELFDTSQSDLDMRDPGWGSQSGAPTHWFQDQLNVTQFGLFKNPSTSPNASLWYAQRGSNNLTLLDTLLVPDIFAHLVKWGILARVFAKDGECADPQRAQYAQKRYEFGIEMLALKFMGFMRMNADNRMAKGKGYKPMVRPDAPQPQEQQAAPDDNMIPR
jgi:hypothetical protein